MALNVKTNTAATTTLKHLGRTTRDLSRSFERISSGMRISRAADDAAGLGVAENLRAAHTSARVATRNINDGVSIIAIAEGSANEVANIIVRMRELAVQSASETLGTTERGYIQTEFVALSAEVDRISAVTEFNGQPLADGTLPSLDVQVGINSTASDVITIALGDLTATTLGVDTATVSLATVAGAQAALGAFDTALGAVSSSSSSGGLWRWRARASVLQAGGLTGIPKRHLPWPSA